MFWSCGKSSSRSERYRMKGNEMEDLNDLASLSTIWFPDTLHADRNDDFFIVVYTNTEPPSTTITCPVPYCCFMVYKKACAISPASPTRFTGKRSPKPT